ncbi:MAG: hypothetical protein LQ351_000099 [Letrouitia transgressa]|nr:MAG: hypothetical protein LQ351_000099 [Letrouitia transgressa]
MDHILQGLNDAQRSAVTSPSDVLQILAPPGSGKTKTLTARVAYLIQHAKYKPWDIICLTFTIKSSKEMKERLSSLVGNGIETKLILGTFHSVCRRYLVSYGHLIDIRRGFGIADSSDSLAIIKRIIKRMRLDIEPQVARSRISSSKSKGIGYAALTTGAAKNKSANQQDFFLVFEEYEKQLEQSNLLDYDDLLLRCVDLLKQYPSCVSNVEAVLIDEFQDTNVVQFDLMRLFAAYKKRVTTVGDPDQSIYGWRSAEVKNLQRMQQCYKDSLVIHLNENYRSSATILLAAQDVIEQDESRPNKTLSPTHCPGTVPVLRRLPSSEVEASWLVSEIQRSMALTGDLLNYADFAILLRSAALSRQIESAMGRAGIPYRMVGGQRFFDRVEIRLLLDYLRVVSQPNNNDALARVVVVPARGVGQATVKSLLEEAESSKVALWSLIRNAMTGHATTKTKINKPAEKGLGLLINLILTARQKLVSVVNPLSPKDLLEHIITKLRFREYLEKAYEIDHENRWANVEELLSQATDYSISSDKNLSVTVDSDTLPIIEGTEQAKGNIGEDALSKFLSNVALATELQKTDLSNETGNNFQVTISTIHAAKGLEWPVVFIPSAYEGSIPHSRAEDTDEERRLLYVAMTRAQALLYISCPKKNSQREESSLSKFLMPKSLGCYLTNKGPEFDYATINDISRILRRQMPSEFKITEGFAKAKNLNDDLWPLNGDEEQEEEISRWDKKREDCNERIGQPSAKRRRISANDNRRPPNIVSLSSMTVGSTTTMENASSFSYPSIGFTSASIQMQIQSQSHHQTIVGTAQAARLKDRSKIAIAGERFSAVANRPKTGPRRKDIQGDLMSFWAPTKINTHSTGPPPHAPSPTLPLPHPAQIDKTVETSLSTSPRLPCARSVLSAIPQPLVNHRLKPLINTKPCIEAEDPERIEKPYGFLSSSPPPNSPPRDVLLSITASTDPALDPCDSSRRETVLSNMGVSGQRKTLGVRRDLGGWIRKEFAVPRRVEK